MNFEKRISYADEQAYQKIAFVLGCAESCGSAVCATTYAFLGAQTGAGFHAMAFATA
jgi:hypothetical protein